ncbi:hypothetical protein BurJ1DRAFT_0595 [Burkholderiales bacterium JOSHI_001]|nr:hypothetical protein BurJ1DRAFT_0595 [Burkholderiales bacterium JOSHI_001]
MIPIPRPDLADDQWKHWHDSAQQAMDQLVSQYKPGQEVALQDVVYQEAKPYLMKLSHGKCAYCETLLAANQPGDVEHYRPKGRIRDETGKVVKVKLQNDEIEHPGYWWLAYDWRNLLPSCTDCNRRRHHGLEGVAAGKGDYFAVRGHRAALPSDDLDQEQALLLDPSKPGFDPKQHFEFLPNGTLKPLTEEARHSCELLGLNLREALVSERELSYLQAKQAFASMFAQLLSDAPASTLARVRQQINDMWQGRSAYSAFARQALESVVANLQRTTGTHFELPLP